MAELSADLSARRVLPDAEERDETVAPAAGGEWWSDHTRVAERPVLAVVGEAPDDDPGRDLVGRSDRDPPPVPVPGRHAARRTAPGPRPGAAALLPDTLRGRFALGAPQLAVVAVLVAVGLAVTTWLVIRADPGEPSPTLPPAPVTEPLVPLAPEATAAPGAAGAAAGGEVTVDVAGQVRRPGIVVLDAAGGVRPRVDTTNINLARVLVDGEQILVGAARAAPVPPAGAAPPGGGAAAPGPLLNLNLATQAELEELPEVGPVTAQAIIAWRDEHGGFTAVEELLEVDGIGDATLAQLTPHVTV